MKVSDMTATHTVTLWCDNCRTDSYETDETRADAARRAAAADGWVHYYDDGVHVDVCRGCAFHENDNPEGVSHSRLLDLWNDLWFGSAEE